MTSGLWDGVSLLKRLYDQTLHPVCGSTGVTRMELDILLFLANNPGTDTAADIVHRRKLTKSHVSLSVQSLEKRGFLRRVYAQGNRKSAHLRLLPPSDDAVGQGRAAQRHFMAALFRGFSPEEMREMETAMEKIVDNVRSALKEG